MAWYTWLFRGAERDRAFARLHALRQAYAEVGDRVIRLSTRTELARKTAGSTQRAFAFVEQAFATATAAYAQCNDLIESLTVGLQQGRIGDFLTAEKAVRELRTPFDELERHLSQWEAHWHQVPQDIERMAQELQMLRRQLESGDGLHALGAQMHSMEQYVARIRTVLAEGNPVEAAQMLQDMKIALRKLVEQASRYPSSAT